MTAFELIEEIFGQLPRQSGRSEADISYSAMRLDIAMRFMALNEPLPEAIRETLKEVDRDLKGFDSLGGEENEISKEARDALSAVEHRYKLPRGAPKKDRARVCVQIASDEYRFITGKAAPRSRDGIAKGPLVDLCADLFKALNINAHAASQVKSFWDKEKIK